MQENTNKRCRLCTVFVRVFFDEFQFVAFKTIPQKLSTAECSMVFATSDVSLFIFRKQRQNKVYVSAIHSRNKRLLFPRRITQIIFSTIQSYCTGLGTIDQSNVLERTMKRDHLH